ncbi:MAG: DUF6985 domain-containing protein [Mobilitalea sp.]
MIPNLKKEDIFWEGSIQLDEWKFYFGTNLDVKLNVGGDNIVDKITEIHENAFNYFVAHQSNIIDLVINEVYLNYHSWQEKYEYDEDEKLSLMPNLTCIEDLKKLINPRKIYIMDIETDNIAYCGIEFQCLWDKEHGLGVMIHKSRIVKVGGADTAFMTWIAAEDKVELMLNLMNQ